MIVHTQRLRQLERLIGAERQAGEQTRQAFAAARSAAEPLLACASDDAAAAVAYEIFVGAALCRLLALGEEAESGDAALAARLSELTGASSIALAVRVLGDPALSLLPLQGAICAVRGVLRMFAPVADVWIWMPSPERGPERPTSCAAHGVAAVDGVHGPVAAIVWRPRPGFEPECAALCAHAARALARGFERAALVEQNLDRSRVVDRAAERRLTRIRLDVHDGPLQDVALLSGELEELRNAVATARTGSEWARRALARIEDLAAIVSCLDDDLRELASSLDAPSLARQPFAVGVHGAVRKFAMRTDVEPSVDLIGDFAAMSDSQRIALLRIVQESLSNVRDHSAATDVSISIVADGGYVRAVIHDNGRGFDVEQALTAAAQEGRMGLLGMVERVRLLGGVCDVSSRPGHGTTISLSLAPWRPTPAEAPVALVPQVGSTLIAA